VKVKILISIIISIITPYFRYG